MADRQTKIETAANIFADMVAAREDLEDAIGQMTEFGKNFNIDEDIINEAIEEVTERMGSIKPM